MKTFLRSPQEHFCDHYHHVCIWAVALCLGHFGSPLFHPLGEFIGIFRVVDFEPLEQLLKMLTRIVHHINVIEEHVPQQEPQPLARQIIRSITKPQAWSRSAREALEVFIVCPFICVFFPTAPADVFFIQTFTNSSPFLGDQVSEFLWSIFRVITVVSVTAEAEITSLSAAAAAFVPNVKNMFLF